MHDGSGAPPNQARSLPLTARAVVLALGILGLGLAWGAATPYPGVTVDSGEYLAVAEGLTTGHGFTMPYVNYDEPFRALGEDERVPMSQFPPLYPAFIALVKVGTGISLLGAARAIGAVAFALSIAVAALLVWRHGGRSLFALLAGGLMLAPDILTLHAMVWSETVMILALVASICFLVSHLRSGDLRPLVLCGLCCAAAGVARFAGISVIFAATVALLIGSAPRSARRPFRAAAFLTLSLVPVAAWLVRNKISAGAVSEKKLGWHPPTSDHLSQAGETIGAWVLPGVEGTTALVAGAVVTVVAVAGLFAPVRSLVRTGVTSTPQACLLFGLAYMLLLLASRTLIDRNIPLDPRILAPVQMLAIIGLCAAAAVSKSRPATVGVMALTLIAAVGAVQSVDTARHFSSLAVASYTGDAWRASETLEYAGTVPRHTMILTNAPDPLWLWDERTPLLLPPRANLYSGEPNEKYVAQVLALRSATACRDSIVVFFDRPTRRPRRFIDHVVVRELDLTRTRRFEDGEIYAVGPPPSGCD